MTQRGNDRVAARRRARQRRLTLDADRIAREGRIDAAVGDYELIRVDYDAARTALAAAELALAHAVVAVLAEGEPVERVAALCELTPADVRRLTKLAGDAKARTPRARSGSRPQPAQAPAGVNDVVSVDVA